MPTFTVAMPTAVDVVDILTVAVLCYYVLVGLRRRRVPHALAGMIVLILFVMAARVVGMRLVSFLFGGLVPVLLLALVVLFQEELRRLLDWLTAWGLDRSRSSSPARPADGAGDVLAKTAFDLARARIGALIVLVGKLPLERHVTGGLRLNGVLSDALLKSLFDTGTPGHDGAVVIQGTRVVSFATHLPLSERQESLAGRGTRHAAALGLSERCDALCIAVSEERGRVSVARAGELREVDGPDELRELVRVHERTRQGLPTKRRRLEFLRRNPSLKLASVALSAALWFFFAHESETTYRRFRIPVRPVGLAEGLEVVRVEPESVDLIVSAPRRAFYFFGAGQLGASAPVFEAGPGTKNIYLTASEVALPSGLAFVNLVPRQVVIEIARK